jgi:hypothetical protein
MTLFRRCGVACGVAALCLLSPGDARPADGLPRLVLWAWERPEDLRQLDADIGVAFLAQTVTILGDRFTVRPRLQPLRVPAVNPLIAVTRIETDRSTPVALSADRLDAIALLIARSTRLPGVHGAQIDFDATRSQRELYRALIQQVREQLDPATSLSITALASWCAGDDWLDGVPIDEAVPMLFRMGPANAPFQRMATSPSSAAAPCRGAVGISVDEPPALTRRGRRVYIFNPRTWTRAAVLHARDAIQ